jgi:hypothetical protein
MRSHLLKFAVAAAGILAVVVTGNLFLRANFGSFENPHPTWFYHLLPLWHFLILVPGFIIGFRVSHRPKLISAIAYTLGVAINYWLSDGYGIARQVPTPWSEYFRIMLYNMATAALVGATLAVLGQLLRRLTNRWSARLASSAHERMES